MAWTQRAMERWERGCGRGFSFYRHLIAPMHAGGPDELHAAPLHRLCTLARKMHVRSVLIDDGLARDDVQREIEHLEAFSEVKEGEVTAAVVSFLSRRSGAPELTAEEVIGQAVLITFPAQDGPRSYVFKAVFRLPRSGRRQPQLLLNNYVPASRSFALLVDGHSVDIEGAVFHQQNRYTSVCAHSVVRTLVSTLTGQEVDVAALNELWGYQGGRHVVDKEQIKAAFTHFGLRPVEYDLTARYAVFVGGSMEETNWRALSCLAESGTAGVLAFEINRAVGHVVAVLGFTLNTDEWIPQAAPTYVATPSQEVSSSGWVDHLVIHDDELGPYYCLSRSVLSVGAGNRRELKPAHAIALLPQGVEVSPVQAEDLVRQALPDMFRDIRNLGLGRGTWWKLLTGPEARRVYRTTLADREAYIESVRKLIPWRGREAANWLLDCFERALPDRFWLTEISLPQLYVGNRAKLGEVIVGVEALPRDLQKAILGIRLPSVLALYEEDIDDLGVASFPVSRHSRLLAPKHHGNGW